ncbi:sensor histidine kinase [Chondromyces crocatus]|uniref:histidine kinase n=1 Tax=Chondromyces crocatus TaxID=52 RepID=A0A0K1EB72_CHOCO|nr:HAMP domain-containing sensor histidine kinase [Chondromyces crocatus]AKT38126.1 uncharacterized protein CMC5_022680 [Chondromyces crocatus]
MTWASEAAALERPDASTDDPLSVPALRVQRLQQVAAALSAASGAEDVAAILVQSAVATLGARGGVIGVKSDDGRAMTLLGALGLEPEARARWAGGHREAPSPLSLVVRTGEPIWAESVVKAPIWATTMATLEAEALVCVPLRGQGGALGALGLVFDRPHPFSPGERAFLLALERAGRRELEQAWTREAREARGEHGVCEPGSRESPASTATLPHPLGDDAAARLRRLQRVIAVLAGVRSLSEVAGWVAREALESLGALATVALVAPEGAGGAAGGMGTAGILGVAGEAPEVERVRDALLSRYAQEVFETRAPLWPRSERGGHSDPQRAAARGRPRGRAPSSRAPSSRAPSSRAPSSRRARLEHLACVPWLVDGQPVGALGIWLAHPGVIGDDEQVFVNALVGLGASAVARLRLEEAAQEARARVEAVEREAAMASHMRDQLLRMVSHELRSPLTVILGWSQMLEAGVVRQELVPRAIEMIDRNAREQARLVDELVDVSRAMSGRLTLERAPLALDAVVSRACAELTVEARARNVALSVTLPPSAPAMILADTHRAEQIIGHLLEHALKCTPSGGAIRVQLAVVDQQVSLDVSDTGHGIEPDQLPYVFDPFHPAARHDARRQGGLGLGLAVVRHLVEAHEGSIHVESPGIGRGTTFRVEFPRIV